MKTKFTFSMLLLALATVFQFASAATATFNVTVPNDNGSDGHHQTNSCRMVGDFNGWDVTNSVVMTKVDATHYTITLDESTFKGGKTVADFGGYKYVSGPDWAYVMKGDAPDYAELGNITFSGTSPKEDVVLAWSSVWKDVLPIPGYFTIDIYTPKTVTECYMTGNFNGWLTPGTVAKVDSTDTKMNLVPANSDANGNYFSIKIYTANAYALAFQFTTGKAWMYQQNQGNNSYPDVSQTSALFDAVGDATANPPVAPQITFKRIYPGAAGLKTATFNATVPAGTTTAYIKGDLNGGASTGFIAGTKNIDGTFTFSVPGVDILYYKYYNDQLDTQVEYKADGTIVTDNRTGDAQLQTTFTDVVAGWLGTGVNTVNAAKNLIYSKNSTVIVEGVMSNVEVLSLDGRSLQSENLNGIFTSKTLNKGMYIIRVDGATRKVFVN